MKKVYDIFFKLLVSGIGVIIGFVILSFFNDNKLFVMTNTYAAIALKVFVPLVFAIIFYLISDKIQKLFLA